MIPVKLRQLFPHPKYGSNIDTIPCYGLMELVENEDFDNAKVYLQKCFSQFDIKNIDTVMLGCTHYAFLKNYVRSLLPKNVQIIDGNTETVHQLECEKQLVFKVFALRSARLTRVNYLRSKRYFAGSSH